MGEPLFLKPQFHEKIWGGTKLKEEYGYDIPSDHTGECWAISAHQNGPATIINGVYEGKTLTWLWDNHREYFGNQAGDVFPLLTKILDAKEDLSVQVHPDDVYAKKYAHELGKTECWYVLQADAGAEMYYGHNAKTKEELRSLIDNKQWDKLLRKVPVKKGDFLYVPSGTVHAIGKGIMVLETQQSSDTTYRLYDFDRIDQTTHKKRELHIKESIDVINVPHQDVELKIKTAMHDGCEVTTFVETKYFSVYRWKLNNSQATFKKQAPYTLVSVIDGNGSLIVDGKKYALKKGMHFILPNQVDSWTLDGKMELIASNN
ncbi:mannose-6-phosphate isomerase [Ligilactobacillus hayakitensis DSM 18933 = JCM 14209]|uniref:Mannose-6-phosphate isomerase n=1 Tax=Ligilactobacillus hayakitensis DSM 18933 = JCM 14209 TaxID=1423755 RepID=A0A0R1WWF7_9LACO|nr:mannose-6-phosphate isomerase, class I [Ligilactobacillus hayakitensis]KRM19979.1 mannose-6-phosphate isomerase [Ligilactobacillus hayakitensis DSM 18933 = JCM 14209]